MSSFMCQVTNVMYIQLPNNIPNWQIPEAESQKYKTFQAANYFYKNFPDKVRKLSNECLYSQICFPAPTLILTAQNIGPY